MPKYAVDLTILDPLNTADPGYRMTFHCTADDPEHARRLAIQLHGARTQVHSVEKEWNPRGHRNPIFQQVPNLATFEDLKPGVPVRLHQSANLATGVDELYHPYSFNDYVVVEEPVEFRQGSRQWSVKLRETLRGSATVDRQLDSCGVLPSSFNGEWHPRNYMTIEGGKGRVPPAVEKRSGLPPGWHVRPWS